MEGFSQNCLITFPKIDNWETWAAPRQRQLIRAAEALVKYLKSQAITPYVFSTDTVAYLAVDPDTVEWVNPCTPEDTFFVKKNCEGMENLRETRALSKYYPSARSKVKVVRGMSLEDRFAAIVKRERFVVKNFLPEIKMAATFCTHTQMSYKIDTEENDRRLLLRISSVNFLVEAEMSGQPMSLTYLIKDQPANQPIFDWSV